MIIFSRDICIRCFSMLVDAMWLSKDKKIIVFKKNNCIRFLTVLLAAIKGSENGGAVAAWNNYILKGLSHETLGGVGTD